MGVDPIRPHDVGSTSVKRCRLIPLSVVPKRCCWIKRPHGSRRNRLSCPPRERAAAGLRAVQRADGRAAVGRSEPAAGERDGCRHTSPTGRRASSAGCATVATPSPTSPTGARGCAAPAPTRVAGATVITTTSTPAFLSTHIAARHLPGVGTRLHDAGGAGIEANERQADADQPLLRHRRVAAGAVAECASAFTRYRRKHIHE